MDRYPMIDAGERLARSAAARTGSGDLGRRQLALRLVGELVLMGVVFAAYRQIRFLTRNDTEGAMSNARRVVDFERFFHVFSERSVQDLVMRSEAVVHFLNRYYVMVHFPLTVAFLVWVFWRHHEAYRKIRHCFVGVTIAALAIHVAFPLAPPRMLAGEGFVDTLQVYGPRIYSTDTSESIANQFAAMPSLHFGWAAIVAGAYVSIRGTRRSLWALAHPAITLLAIVATANHYWLDAAVAMVLVAAAAMMLARREVAPSVPALALPQGTWRPALAGGWSNSRALDDQWHPAAAARLGPPPPHRSGLAHARDDRHDRHDRAPTPVGTGADLEVGGRELVLDRAC